MNTKTIAFSLSCLALAACGGGSSGSDDPPPTGGVTEAERINAAIWTANNNPKCSTGTLGSYYWEIGDANGVKASGSRGADAPTATEPMWIFSASKWLYAANVLQKHGASNTEEMKFLNFTSGYSNYTNAPFCLPSIAMDSDTVQGCFPVGGEDTQDPATIDRFAYDSGHMQHHARVYMGLGPADNAALIADLNATIVRQGDTPFFKYELPQLAAGVWSSPAAYAQFLRRLLRGELVIASHLGANKVCAQSASTGCAAAATPESIGSEAWNYSIGHWVEDDPTVGDHAFSSAGGGGFYPWIDSGKTVYGIVARFRNTEPGAGYFSAECGRLIREAWRTGLGVTKTTPTPP